MKVDLLGRDVESDRPQHVGNSLAAFHGFLETAREKLDVFLVGFERQLAFREMFRQRFVVIVDQLDQGAAQFEPHLRIDHDFERRRAGIGLGEFLFQRGLVR